MKIFIVSLIFGGDLNLTINPLMDRSNPKNLSVLKMAKSLSTFMEDSGCVDPWRALNPQTKSFSFFSNVHQVFSRIDYFFIDRYFLNHVTSVKYLAIAISDHAPLQLDI